MKYLILLFLVSCSSVVQQLNTTTHYKKDITFWVNDKKFVGVGVAQKADSYEIYIERSKGKIDVLTLSTCHRNITIEDEGSKAKYVFVPTSIEKESGCPLEIGIYDKQGRHGWGYLLFRQSGSDLAAKMECNGQQTAPVGTSICQSKFGTIQRISFDSPVTFNSAAGCSINKISDKSFEYIMSRGHCYFGFADSNYNFHDHRSFGFEEFIIREL